MPILRPLHTGSTSQNYLFLSSEVTDQSSERCFFVFAAHAESPCLEERVQEAGALQKPKFQLYMPRILLKVSQSSANDQITCNVFFAFSDFSESEGFGLGGGRATRVGAQAYSCRSDSIGSMLAAR
jgi:hypothetical protein